MLNIIRLLGNRTIGFSLGLLIVVELMVGSLVMNLNIEIYPRFLTFDLNYFIHPYRWVHFWFYLLFVTFGVYGINISACFIDSLMNLITARNRIQDRLASLFTHSFIILALLGHFWEGYGASSYQKTIGPEPTHLPGIGQVVVQNVQNLFYPDGSLKDSELVIRIDRGQGEPATKQISYNSPAIFNWGTRAIIIQSAREHVAGFVLKNRTNEKRFPLQLGSVLSLQGGTLHVIKIYPDWNGVPLALLSWQAVNQPPRKVFLVLDTQMARHTSLVLDRHTYSLEKVMKKPAAQLLIKHNPAIPLAVLSVLFLSLGMGLMIRRRPDRGAQAIPGPSLRP